MGKSTTFVKFSYKLISFFRQVIRIRYDMLFRSNIWDSLYDIQPRTDTALPLNSFDLHEMRYTLRHLSSEKTLYAPDCGHFGGVNDQFGISSGDLHTALYPDRARLDVLRSLYGSAEQFAFHFHAEISLLSRAKQLGVTIIKLAFCHSNIRLQPRRPDLCSFTKPGRSFARGNDCCQRFCADIETRLQRRKSLTSRLTTLEDYAEHYGLSTTSSSFYYFHLSRQGPVRCFYADWGKHQRWDAFDNMSLPFIQVTRDTNKLEDFEIFTACQNQVQ